MSTRSDVDLVVLGAGATGLATAFEARRRGASVLLVERSRTGGDCTWTGCVPSKALIARAADVHAARRYGHDEPVDGRRVLGEVRAAIADVADDESPAVLTKLGIDVRHGAATVDAGGRVTVDGRRVDARAVVLATGAVPFVPDMLADARPLTSETVFELDDLPASLAVVGGGPIGVELGHAFARLGVRVTLVCAAERLLPREEPETSRVVEAALVADGVDVRTATTATKSAHDGVAATIVLDDGTTVEAQHVLAATGRRPSTDAVAGSGIALTDRGAVVVDDRLRTSLPGVFAAGDVTGGPYLTSRGWDMGAAAAANALARRPRRRWDETVVPRGVFTDPEVGRVGLSEAEAFAVHGENARVAFVRMRRSDRARAVGRTEGFVKLVAGPRPIVGNLGGGRLLGATVVCPGGADVVQEAALVMRVGAFTGRLAQTIHGYPTWSLSLRQAAAQFFRAEAGGRARPARDPDAD